MTLDEKLEQVCQSFRIEGEYLGHEVIQNGNVNQTYRVIFRLENGVEKSFLLQNVNTYAFRDPIHLMENIDRVTEHIRSRYPQQTCLHFHHTADRKTYVMEEKDFWRMTNYIPSVTYNALQDTTVVYNAGRAFGQFQRQLADFDISLLYETIPGFHNTRQRYEKLEQAIAEDAVGRVDLVQDEIDYLRSLREEACCLTDLLNAGELPLRVTHNDTKINNVLFAPKDNSPLVVIDLDTVMPGLIGHDFGDAIRFAANYVEEDCPEPEKAGVDMEIFRAFAKGFLSVTAGTMTRKELDTLAASCLALTAELSVRFLDDYIRGDPYFKIRYPEHNLVRARCQIALCRDMKTKLPQMEAIIRECVAAL